MARPLEDELFFCGFPNVIKLSDISKMRILCLLLILGDVVLSKPSREKNNKFGTEKVETIEKYF